MSLIDIKRAALSNRETASIAPSHVVVVDERGRAELVPRVSLPFLGMTLLERSRISAKAKDAHLGGVEEC